MPSLFACYSIVCRNRFRECEMPGLCTFGCRVHLRMSCHRHFPRRISDALLTLLGDSDSFARFGLSCFPVNFQDGVLVFRVVPICYRTEHSRIHSFFVRFSLIERFIFYQGLSVDQGVVATPTLCLHLYGIWKGKSQTSS